ncbi:tetratricopeptide repeat protein [Roseivirga sp. BDSF3-8]|uniref:tetratricopeptide repeat protein n=1 Tax=Roseivirga sp. BDSF3-8 TaxID=3241598 RepID=UPI00353273DB
MKRLLPVIILLITLCSCEKEQIPEGGNTTPSNFRTVSSLNKGAREIYKEDPDKAIQMAKQALSLAEEEGYLEGQKQSHNTLSFIYLKGAEDKRLAEYHSSEFIRLNKEVEENNDLALLNYNKGYTLFKQDQLSESVPYLFEARDLYHGQGDFEKEAYSLYALSLIFEKVKQYEKGIEYLNKVNFEALDKNFSWSVYHLRGNLNFKLGNFREAQRDFSKSYEIVVELKKEEKALMLLTALSLVSINQNDFEAADSYLEQGISKASELTHDGYLAKFYLNYGLRFLTSEQYHEANKWSYKAAAISKRTNAFDLQATALLNLSNGYYHLEKLDSALNYAELGLLLTTDSVSQTTSDLHYNCALFSKALGDLASYHEHNSKIKDIRIHSLETSQYGGVHKQELAYRDKVDERRYLAYRDNVHQEIAQHQRYKHFYLMVSIVFAFGLVFILAMRLPIRYIMKRAERYTFLMEELMAAFKKRMRGKGPIYPAPEPLKPPELRDERDLHNLWRKDRHGRKGDKDKGKDDPAPGLDDDDE